MRGSWFVATVLFVGCHGAGSEGPAQTCAPCSAPALVPKGALPDSLDELSGLVASRTHAGLYWGHNDHGSKTEVFAFKPSGKLRSRHTLTGATCVDCEDIALVACPAGTCLLVADVGDNDGTRAEVALLRVAEPDPDLGDSPTAVVERFPFVYPDGPHDAEALIADPGGDHVWVVLKQPDRGRSAAVFRVGPLVTPGARLVAEPSFQLTFPSDAGAISGASVHPCAPVVLLRAAGALWQLAGGADATLEAAFAATPVALPVAAEVNGEAVAWRADGAGYVTAGEGKNAPITEASCR